MQQPLSIVINSNTKHISIYDGLMQCSPRGFVSWSWTVKNGTVVWGPPQIIRRTHLGECCSTLSIGKFSPRNFLRSEYFLHTIYEAFETHILITNFSFSYINYFCTCGRENTPLNWAHTMCHTYIIVMNSRRIIIINRR